MGVRDGRPNACAGRQVNRRVEGRPLERLLPQRIPVAYIQSAENKSGRLLQTL